MNTIVIGSGLSGLMAAYVSRKRGDNVTLLTDGAGTLAQNSGGIDVLARAEKSSAIASPREGMQSLPNTHPYKKIGVEHIEAALVEFLAIMRKYGLPYHGNLDEFIKIPTAIGTLKPTSFAPDSLDGKPLFTAKKIIVVGIERLKDYYGDVLADNLSKILPDASFENITVNLSLSSGRDVTTIDVARILENEEYLEKLIKALKPYKKKDGVFLLPQILGIKGDAVHKKITEALNSPVIETTCLPPSVNGIRIERILRRALSDIGVNFVENARVFRGSFDNNRIKAVVTRATVRDFKHRADKFILATGGFYGGGILLESFNSPHEAIFRLPVWLPEGEENWANEKLFASTPQGFATAGILTDNKLRPINKHNEVIYNNLFIVGRNLGGYDFCFEHSGNGVALASAYYAAIQEVE